MAAFTATTTTTSSSSSSYSLKSPLRSPLRTPSKRVILGNKSTNSPVQNTFKHNASPSPNKFDIDKIKLRTTASPSLEDNKVDMARRKQTPIPTNLVAGQKRGIDQVKDEDHVGNKLTKEEGNDDKKLSKQETKVVIKHDSVTKDDHSFGSAVLYESIEADDIKQTPTRQVPNNADIASESGNQFLATSQSSESMKQDIGAANHKEEGTVPFEEKFNVPIELSQDTLVKLNETPLPQNRTHVKPDSFDSDFSQGSAGMSSFLDFDHEEGGKAESKTSPASEKTVIEGGAIDERKKMVKETADKLKAVLGYAAYKVKTGQVHKTIDEITAARSARSPSLPPVSEETAEPGKGVMSSASKAANGLLDLGRSRR